MRGLSLTGRSLARLKKVGSIFFEALPLSSTKAPESPAANIMVLSPHVIASHFNTNVIQK